MDPDAIQVVSELSGNVGQSSNAGNLLWWYRRRGESHTLELVSASSE